MSENNTFVICVTVGLIVSVLCMTKCTMERDKLPSNKVDVVP